MLIISDIIFVMKNDIKLKNLKGTVDYLPTEQILRERVFSVMKNTFEKYGFMPLDSAILCPFELCVGHR